MSERENPKVVAVVPDLFFQARIREAAAIRGVPLAFATTEDALRQAVAGGGVGLVIVSLEARSPDPMEAIRIARGRPEVRIVGYLNHVLEDLKARALEAGCHEVMPKGAFSKGLGGLLEACEAGREA